MTTASFTPGHGAQEPRPLFDVLVVDPPWSYGKPTPERTCSRNVGARHYRTMSISDIIAVTPVANIAAPDAHLYLWTTNPKLPLAFDVMASWGFTYKTTLTWVKTRKDGGVHGGGMGWFFRGATEHVLFGVRGNKPIPSAVRLPNVVLARTTGHSRKPSAFYDVVERVSTPSAAVDVYCRGVPRAGWWGWGDEVTL